MLYAAVAAGGATTFFKSSAFSAAGAVQHVRWCLHDSRKQHAAAMSQRQKQW